MDKPLTDTPLNQDQIVGFIDEVNESGIYGWAYSEKALSQPAILRFHIDDRFVCEVECAKYRSDVHAAGHPRAEVGFHVGIPRAYFDSQQHSYHFTSLDGTDAGLMAVGSPPTIRRSFQFAIYFDPEFYTRYYRDAKGLPTQDAYNHWASRAATEPRHPNTDRLFAELEAASGGLPDDFSPRLYRFLNQDIAGQLEQDWEAAAHFLKTGRKDNRPYSFAKNTFVVDLYFSGIAPALSRLEALTAERGATLYTSLTDLLNRNGITSDAFLKLLNVSDYVADNPAAELGTQLQCIRHFAEIGIRLAKPLSFDHHFDPAFVAEIDPDYAVLDPTAAYLHWINSGIEAGIPPNHAAFLTGLGLADVGQFPAGFNADIYLAKNPELKPALRSKWAALRHFIEQGLAEGREGCPISPGAYDIYRAVADRLAVANQLKSARRIYETLLAADPRSTLGNRHYGDCLLRLDEPFLAARIYQQTILAGNDNIWTHLNLTLCYIKLRQWGDACAAMRNISAARAGDRALQRRYREVLNEAYGALAAEANWFASNKFYAEARLRMRQACELLTGPLLPATPARATAPVRSIALVADLGLPQCKFYRVDQKMEQLEAAGIACQMIDYRADVFRFIRESLAVDAAIFYRVPATPDVIWSIWLLRKAGIPVFYEIDDLMFDEAHFPDGFESYGGQISHDLYATLITGTVSIAAAMSVCDYAIASTPSLAAAMAPRVIAGNAFVHRNALGKLHQASCRMISNAASRETVRIFYGSGTRAHNEDFELHLAKPLARLLGKWGRQAELFIMGYLTLPRALRPYHEQITLRAPIWDLRAYWNVLREMDISLAVLKPGLLADCKSEIKWLEAAMLGVPSVVTATRTYAEVIESPRTGLLVDDSAGWFRQLDALVGDAARRRQIGGAARAVALERYSMRSMADNLRHIMDQITAPPRLAAKRILIVNVFYPPQAIGGATRVVADNVGDLVATCGDSFEIEVFTTMEGSAEPYMPLTYLEGGIRVTAVPTPLDPEIDAKVWDDRMAGHFERVIDRFEPDLIHFHCIQRITLSVCDAARRRAIPYIVTVHDGWWISDEQFLMNQYGKPEIYDFANKLNEFASGDSARLERMNMKQEYLAGAVRILAVSEPFARLYRQCGFANVIAIPNGVSRFEVLPRTQSADGRLRLAHIGGTAFHKGYHLVRAALFRGQFENLSLLVIDHGMDPGAVRHAVWGKTPVTFRAKFPQARIGELYRQIDVLLCPSVWPESYGLVAREAALAGCRVVASDRGAIAQDAQRDSDFIVDVGSSDALAAVLAALNANAEIYRSVAPPRPNLRTAAAQADDLAALYRTLLDLQRPEPAATPADVKRVMPRRKQKLVA